MSKFKPILFAYPENNDATQIAVRQFADAVSHRTDGQITFVTLPISKVAHQSALVGMLKEGRVDMALAAHERFIVCSPLFGCIGLPYIFDDHGHADRVLDGEFSAAAVPALRDMGMIYLGSWEWGFRQITNVRHPVRSPEDMHGLKIRVPTTALFGATIVAFGGTLVMVEYEKISRAIRQGFVDGQENPVAVIHSLGLQHEQKYLSLLNYCYGTIVHAVNENSFKRLALEHQDILREESRAAAQLMRRQLRSQESDQLGAFARQGMQIDRPDPAPFKALVAPVFERLYEAHGAETVNTFLDMVERQRKVTEQVVT